MTSSSAPTGERVIATYKLVKALVQAILGVGLIIAAAAGFAHALHNIALHLREHASAAWSVKLAEKLITVSTRRSLLIASCALLLDAAFSAFEGWSLRRGFWWSAWLIVIATGTLLPWEIFSLARRYSLWHVLLLVANLTIVLYLLYRRLVAHGVFPIRRRQVGETLAP